MNKIKVLIIDDSALVRNTLATILSGDPIFAIVGKASDPYEAVKLMREVAPDVITLDIEMPKMDGITFLRKLMSQHPIPVIVISTLTKKNSDLYLHALDCGAVEIIEKPKVNTKELLEQSSMRLIDMVKAASKVDVLKLKQLLSSKNYKIEPKYSADVVLQKPLLSTTASTEKIIAIGASTGGTEAIRAILETMPVDVPGIVIVQHMPEIFTSQFAKRLDGICKIHVKEAEDKDQVIPGQALIAPGNKHMILKRSGANYFVELLDGPLVSRHRPSVDVLFRSVSINAGKNAVGVILTGMGDDGAKGLLEMKESGSVNIAQNEESCVVFGMPKEAIAKNAADYIVHLNDIPKTILKIIQKI